MLIFAHLNINLFRNKFECLSKRHGSNKWLINCSYNCHKNNIGAYLNKLSKSFDLFYSDHG